MSENTPETTRKDLNDLVELRKIADAVVRWWWLLAVATIVGAWIGLMVSRWQTPVYAATTTLLVGQSIQSIEPESRDITVSEQLAQTYAQLARTQPVLQEVIEAVEITEGVRIGVTWQELRKRVTVTPAEGTRLLKIRVQAPSPAEAQALANLMAAALISLSPTGSPGAEQGEDGRFTRLRLEQLRFNISLGQRRVDELEALLLAPESVSLRQEYQSELTSLQTLIVGWEANYARLFGLVDPAGSPNSLTVVEPAQAPSSPIYPRTLVNIAVAALAGFAIALTVVVFSEFQDDTLRSPADFDNALGIDTLGIIGKIKGDNKLITAKEPRSSIAEAYAELRTNIRIRQNNQFPMTIMITSPNRGEGKSVTVANLGVVMAQAGFRTIVVDTHLLLPVLHQIFEVLYQGGILDALQTEETEFKYHLKYTGVANLQVLTRGTMPSGRITHKNDPRAPQYAIAVMWSQLLASHLDQMVASLSESADVIIFDSPPLLTHADAVTLAGQVDWVVLVIDAGQTGIAAARQAVFRLQQGGAKIMGGVLNHIPTKRWYPSFHRAL